MRVIVRKERPHSRRSCGSPTSTGTGSPRSPPTPGKGSSRTSNCGTAAGPAVRTGSETPRTPGCGTFPSRASPRTSCGARSSPWPASCWPRPRCSPWPGPPAAGTETAPAAPVLGRRAPGPRRPPAPAPPRRTMALGPPDHHRSHPPASHPVRLTIRNDPCNTEGATLGPVETPPTRRDSRAAGHALPENQPQPNTSSHHVRHAKD